MKDTRSFAGGPSNWCFFSHGGSRIWTGGLVGRSPDEATAQSPAWSRLRFQCRRPRAQFATHSSLNPRRDRHADGGTGDLDKGKNELSGQAAARTCAVHCERQGMRDKAGVSQLLENARTAIWLAWANNSPSPALRISLMRTMN